jgi:hypothetical protein
LIDVNTFWDIDFLQQRGNIYHAAVCFMKRTLPTDTRTACEKCCPNLRPDFQKPSGFNIFTA